MAYIQKNHPYPVTSCGRRRTFMQGGDPGDDRTKESPYNKLDHTNTKCWPGKEKVGTKPSPTRPGVTVNDCK